MRLAGMPARRAFSNSPPLTTSAPAPSAAEQRQHRSAVVGLDRVMHVHVQTRVGHGAGQRLVACPHRGGGVDPGRRAHGVGDAGERNIVQQQPVHGVVLKPGPSGDQVRDGWIAVMGR